MPRGLQPAAPQPRDERINQARLLATAASTTSRERRAKHAHLAHMHENVDPTMAPTFSTATSLPTHLKLCPFTRTLAEGLQRDASLGTCFARWMTRQGWYSWHHVTPAVLYAHLQYLVDTGEALLDSAQPPPLIPTGAWANGCQRFLDGAGIWAPESLLLPLPGMRQEDLSQASMSGCTLQNSLLTCCVKYVHQGPLLRSIR